MPPLANRPPEWLPIAWQPGEHLAIVGNTGTGKSTLAAWLLSHRLYWMVLRSKPDQVTYPGLPRVSRSASGLLLDNRRQTAILDPPYKQQTKEFYRALEGAWQQGGWTVYLDELFYLDRLGLRPEIDMLLTQGRSKGITVMAGMQRPVAVTRFAISQATHVVAFQQEGRDANTPAEGSTELVGWTAKQLPKHAFVWYSRPNSLWTGRLDLATNALQEIQV